MKTMTDNAMLLARTLAGSSSEARVVLLNLVARVDIATGMMRISFACGGLHRELGIEWRSEQGEDQSTESSDSPILTLPFDMRRRGVEARLIVGDALQQPARVDESLVQVVGRARRWLSQLNAESHPTIASLARHLGVDDGEISRILPLAFLAPNIVEGIVEGRHPLDLTGRKLIRLKPLPALWADQRRALVFPAI